MKLGEVIQFDPKRGVFALASAGQDNNDMQASLRQAEVDELLAECSAGGLASMGIHDAKEAHSMLAANVAPPIERALTYTRWTNLFFQEQGYTTGEDNSLPVDGIVVMAWQTTAQGSVRFTRPGYQWVRPTLTAYDAGLEMNWATMRRAGWNILERAMRRTMGELSRKIDAAALSALDTAIAGVSHNNTVSGGSFTKASADSVIKDSASIGLPVTVAALNPGRLADMADWSGGVFTSGLPETAAMALLTTLYFSSYGNVRWHTNPQIPTNKIYFGGPAGNTGYEQRMGAMRTYSDVDIRNKYDIHTVESPEIGWYVGQPYSLWSITITS